jgi:hypothetical protein
MFLEDKMSRVAGRLHMTHGHMVDDVERVASLGAVMIPFLASELRGGPDFLRHSAV